MATCFPSTSISHSLSSILYAPHCCGGFSFFEEDYYTTICEEFWRPPFLLCKVSDLGAASVNLLMRLLLRQVTVTVEGKWVTQALQKWEGNVETAWTTVRPILPTLKNSAFPDNLYTLPIEASHSFNLKRRSLSHQMLVDFVIRIVAEKASMTC